MSFSQKLVLVTLFGFLLRCLYAALIYEPSYLVFHQGDYTLYRIAAEEILRGDLTFTNSLYLIRPPLFPLMVAALGVYSTLVLVANILLGTAIIPLTYVLGRQFSLSPNLALVGSLVLALDITSIRYSGVLLAEPLANFLLSILFVLLAHLWNTERIRPTVVIGLLVGFLVALAAFARPSSYLLWVVIVLWLMLFHQRRFLAAIAVIIIVIPGTQLWQWHNATTFGNHTYTTIGTFNLVYYRAASVLYQATNMDIDTVYATLATRIEERLGNDITSVGAGTRYSHTAASAEVEGAMQAVAFEVFLEYPMFYILTIPVGVYRILLSTSGFPLWLSLIWNTGLLVCTTVGLLSLLYKRQWAECLFFAFIIGYFIAGTLLVQTSGIDTRARSMVMPLFTVLAVMGGRQLLGHLRQQKVLADSTAHGSPPTSSPSARD